MVLKSKLLSLIREIVVDANGLMDYGFPRRKSCEIYQDGGRVSQRISRLGGVGTDYKEILYHINAKLMIDGEIEGRKGVFWYLDKNTATLDQKLEDLLDLVRLKAVKTIRKAKHLNKALSPKIKIGAALMGIVKMKLWKARCENKHRTMGPKISEEVTAIEETE